ncbi:hypothetical protein ACIQU4_35990 [Streptomyces sp. NPDC090741]|uniref:hypothetical protein n=1 Tax=Streptomyces sp. NPDC090741 TaxID=3365967 RepID=UPI0038199C07
MTSVSRPNEHGPPPFGTSSSRPPAPVIAKALGYHEETATRLVTEAGGTWSRYAPGDHER